ncbi:20663_t:CDS:2, partial [Dentiscutata erythropus]
IENFIPFGNQDIDNLIKATHSKNFKLKYRLEWIQFSDFVNIKRIGTGGFIVLKVLKDSSNIDSAFLKELQNIAESQPNSTDVKLFNVMECHNIQIRIIIYLLCPICLMEAFKWVHENKIIHRDIHGGNILI